MCEGAPQRTLENNFDPPVRINHGGGHIFLGVIDMNDSRLISALDFHNEKDAKNLVETLGDAVGFYKVGMELFYSVGPDIVRWLKARDKKIFLDLKLHDIPNTVAEGLCSLLALGADMLNIHASGGFTMMKTAADKLKLRAEELGVERPKLIAVTVLTSINENDWDELGYQTNVTNQVVRLARLSLKAGLDGVVASPREAKAIRQACGEDFLIVTPGIRPAGASIDDQCRIETPASALKNGANYLVIGRPIRAAADPKAAAQSIVEEMNAVE